MKPDRTILPDMVQQTLWRLHDIILAENDGNIMGALRSITAETNSALRRAVEVELWSNIPGWWQWFHSYTTPAADITAYVKRRQRRALRLIRRTIVTRQIEHIAREVA